MKYLTLAAALVASMVLADAAVARGRRGGCGGGTCAVREPIQKGAVQAPIQKGLAAKEPSPSDAPQAPTADAAEPAAQPQVATGTTQRTRRVVFSRLGRRTR